MGKLRFPQRNKVVREGWYIHEEIKAHGVSSEERQTTVSN